MGFCFLPCALILVALPPGQTLIEQGEKAENLGVPKPPISHEPAYKRAAKMLSNAMNTTHDPCNSFYEYSCDRYHRDEDVLSGQQEVAFNIMAKALRNITEHAPLPLRQYKALNDACVRNKQAPQSSFDPGRVVRLVSEFTNKTGFRFPLLDEETHTKWPDAVTLARALGYLSIMNLVEPLLVEGVHQDYKGDLAYQLYVGPAVPRSGTRDVVFAKMRVASGGAEDILQRYASLVGRHISEDALKTTSDEIEKFGEVLEGEVNAFDESDLNAAHNVYTLSEADRAFGGFFNFTEYMRYLAVQSSQKAVKYITSPNFTFSLTSPSYMYKLASLVSDGNPYGFRPETVYNYVYWSLLDRYAESFMPPRAASHANTKTHEDLLLECLREETALDIKPTWPMSDRIFVDAVLPTNASKQELQRSAHELLSGVVDAFKSMVSQLTWMTEKTKQAAYDKIQKMVKEVGWPEFVTDDARLTEHYSGLDFDSTGGNYGLMKEELERFVKLREIETLHEKHIFDRRDWVCPSARANAFYSNEKNGFFICLTSILAPMFEAQWPESIKYAYAGAIMGHELTHGFDTNGVDYDGEGRLRTWMDAPSKLGFKNMAKCIVHEYDQFCATPVMGKNCTKIGEATQAENIADNGGLRAAYRAYRNVVEVKGADARLPGRLMSGYNHDQLFFLSYANLWCNGAKQATSWKDDPHSPDKFRIEGTLKNIAAFAAAFNCPPNSTYAPKNHCDIWISKPSS